MKEFAENLIARINDPNTSEADKKLIKEMLQQILQLEQELLNKINRGLNN